MKFFKSLALIVAGAFCLGGAQIGTMEVMEKMAKPAVYEISESMNILNGRAYITMGNNMIDMTNTEQILQDIEYIKLTGIKYVKITIDSPGGHVFAMWAVCDALQELKDSGVFIHTHVAGVAASAASAIFLAGDKRTMGDRAIIMIHAHSGVVSPYAAESENKMLEKWAEQMVDMIVKQTKMSKEEVEKHVSLGKNQRTDALYLDKEEALEKGFITE